MVRLKGVQICNNKEVQNETTGLYGCTLQSNHHYIVTMLASSKGKVLQNHEITTMNMTKFEWMRSGEVIHIYNLFHRLSSAL